MAGDIGFADGVLGSESEVPNLPLVCGEFVGAGDQAEAKAAAVCVFHLSAEVA